MIKCRWILLLKHSLSYLHVVRCLEAAGCDRGLSKGKLFNSASRDKRWDERDREASVRIYRGAPVHKCCFRQTTVEYEILSLMLPPTTTDDRPTFVPSICLSSTHAKQIHLRIERLRANENQMENSAMKCRRFAFMRNVERAWSNYKIGIDTNKATELLKN